MKRFVLLGSLALALAGCEEKPKPEQTTATTAAAQPAEPTPADKAGTPAATEPVAQKVEQADDLPTVGDFEEEAEQRITSANLEQELNTLEKEIGPEVKK